MTKSISIRHVSWRDGRPRITPGPKMRKLGFQSRDLKRPDGTWMNAGEALAASQALDRELAARRAAIAAGGRLKPLPRGRAITIEHLFELYLRAIGRAAVTVGKRKERGLAPATIRDYRHKARVIERHDVELWQSPVMALSRPILIGLFEQLWEGYGLASARGAMATLSAAITWGMDKGELTFTHNPAHRLGMTMPTPRLRAATPAEITHLVAAADALGRHDVGDLIVLGVWTGQRQADRLNLVDRGLVDRRRVFVQQKTRAIVAIPETAQLAARLTAMRERRAAMTVEWPQACVSEATNVPWTGNHYRHVFARVRAAAAAGIVELDGVRIVVPTKPDAGLRKRLAGATWLIRPLPSIADLTDQDLRDTSVTWLARAGCSLPEIGAITGHSLASIHQIMRHYLAAHPELADNAIAKLVTWYEKETSA